MAARPLTDEQLSEAVSLLKEHGTVSAAALATGLSRNAFNNRIIHAAERGFLGTKPVLPGYAIKKTSTQLGPDGELQREWIQQSKAPGEEFAVPPGHIVKGVSALVDGDGRIIQQWMKTNQADASAEAALRAIADALKEELPQALPVKPPSHAHEQLLNQFTVTDLHFGMLAWGEETGAEDYDLKIAEQLLLDWFAAAVEMAPRARTAVFAQIGDLLHHDSHESVTPAHRNVLDADSRFQKMVRVVIRTLRRIIAMLLEKHEHVHVIMADANHDPASGAWLREMLAAFYEGEPRLTVDSSAGSYYVYEHGSTSLFYHHGHKRKVSDVDSVFAGRFRDVYGRTKYSYAHLGHLHSDALESTNLMKVERHETLAAPDAYAANGGWLAGRSAKVITYHKDAGEVARLTLTPEMVRGAA